MNYWDSSAVVALLVEQPGSEAVAKVLADDTELLVWWGTRVECVAALSRLLRERVLSAEGASHARADLSSLAAAWVEVEPSEAVRDKAQTLAAKHPLRAADAFQLAAAAVSLSGEGFVCLDRQLVTAARAEGLRVLPRRMNR